MNHLLTIEDVKLHGKYKSGVMRYDKTNNKKKVVVPGHSIWKHNSDWYYIDEINNEFSLLAGNGHTGKTIKL